MGFERHATALCLKMQRQGVAFGRVLTLGHQSLLLTIEELDRVLKQLHRPPLAQVPAFADDLLVALGATLVEALDTSPYEGAQVVHDLNLPVPTHWHQRYDTIFDGGALEHVFNFPTAIRSCMEMLKPGGRFISVTVANNWCGHGFYQFSPELFYRIFSSNNGFNVVEMYLAEADGQTYAVSDPATMTSRVELCNGTRTYLLVHARRNTAENIFNNPPQQSDYAAAWQARPPQSNSCVKRSSFIEMLVPRKLKNLKRRVLVRQYLRSCSLQNRKFYTPVDLTI
jgi:SAM-dependent methyltransferase